MTKMKRFLSMLVAALMLLTLPALTGITRASADTEQNDPKVVGYDLTVGNGYRQFGEVLVRVDGVQYGPDDYDENDELIIEGIAAGTSIIMTFEPIAGYELIEIFDIEGTDWLPEVINNEMKFEMRAKDMGFKVAFAEADPSADTYDVHVAFSPSADCATDWHVEPNTNVVPGTDVRSVWAQPAEGWKLVGVTVVDEDGNACEPSVNPSKYGFVMPESDAYLTFVFEEINPSDGPEFVQQRLLLDGAIIIQFMVRLPEIDGYVYDRIEFTIAGSPVEDWVSDRTVAYAEATYDESYGLYCFNYPVTSIQMADLVTATLYYTVDGEEQTLVKENYSAKQYFLDYDAYQSNPENTPITGVMKNAIEATADYGHFVQKYLESIRPWTIGDSYDSADHLVMDKNYQSDDYTDEQISAAGTGLAAYEYTFTNECASIKSGTFSLSLESELGINVILKPVDGYTGKILVSIDGGEAVEVALQTSGNYAGRYLISLKNIKAHKLGVEHTFEAWTADDTTAKTTLTCSGLSYVNVLYTKLSNNEKAVNAAVAIYRYAMAANGAK